MSDKTVWVYVDETDCGVDNRLFFDSRDVAIEYMLAQMHEYTIIFYGEGNMEDFIRSEQRFVKTWTPGGYENVPTPSAEKIIAENLRLIHKAKTEGTYRWYKMGNSHDISVEEVEILSVAPKVIKRHA